MKMKFISGKIISLILLISLLVLSCSKPDNDIFRMIPETATAVVSFNPGQLLEKGKIQEIGFLKEEAAQNELSRQIFEDPESSGIEMNAYSAFFILMKESQYGVALMPVKSKTDLEQFIKDVEKESGKDFIRGKIKGFETLEQEDALLLYDNSCVMIVTEMNGWAGNTLSEVAETIINTEKDEALLTDKDFKNFLVKQKDINIWISSNNIEGIGDMGEGLELFGGLKNNYGHVFADFQDGFMTIKTNLRFSASLQETIDKFNFLDEKAIKELLNYLPSENLLFVGNTNIDTEKVFDLLSFINKDFDRTLDNMASDLEVEKEKIKELFSGEIAFSLNVADKENTESDKISIENLPGIVFAARIKKESGFNLLLEKASEWSNIQQKNGYYIISQGIKIYLVKNGKDMIISNNEEIISEIESSGKIKENVTKAEYSDILVSNPVCFFMNLDNDHYSEEMKKIIENRIPDGLNTASENLSNQLKSLTVSANIEEWEFRMDLTDKNQNILYTLLSEMDD